MYLALKGQNLTDIPVNLNPQITWLDLRNNLIESVPNIFENLSVCNTLILSHNQTRKIEMNSFQVCERNKNEIAAVILVQSFDLVTQATKTCHPMCFCFTGLKSVKRLTLDNNLIESIQEHALARLPKLERLYLENNKLSSVSNTFFSSLGGVANQESNYKYRQVLYVLYLSHNIVTIYQKAFTTLGGLQFVPQSQSPDVFKFKSF